jgi:hypothetical protein
LSCYPVHRHQGPGRDRRRRRGPEPDLEITVEITASKKDGFPGDKTRIVAENARTPKFDQFGFEDH